MSELAFYLKKNIRLRTTLYNCKSSILKTDINQSKKTLSLNKTHNKSIKTFTNLLPFEKKLDQTQRYSKNLLSQSRITFKSSRKFVGTRLKKNQSRNRLSNEVTNINLSHLHLTTKSWCMFDQRQKKHFGFREDYKREIASLTKIMTTIVAIQIMNKLNISPRTVVKVTHNACNCIGTTANLKRNCWISLENLLYGTMLPSGNDAAFTLAEYIGYFVNFNKKNAPKIGFFASLQKMDLSRESTTLCNLEFIHQMNQLAKKIGLMQSTFSNPHGLQNALNISSAKDILKLSIYACKNKLFKKIVNSKEHYYELFEDQECTKKLVKRWENTNKLLEKGWEGVKTGLTSSAGSCLSSAKEGIYIVVLNCSSNETRFTDTQKIYSWYRNTFPVQKIQEQISKRSKGRLPSEQMSIAEAISTDIQN